MQNEIRWWPDGNICFHHCIAIKLASRIALTRVQRVKQSRRVHLRGILRNGFPAKLLTFSEPCVSIRHRVIHSFMTRPRQPNLYNLERVPLPGRRIYLSVYIAHRSTELLSEVKVSMSHGSNSSYNCSPVPLTMAPSALAASVRTSGTGSRRLVFSPGMTDAR